MHKFLLAFFLLCFSFSAIAENVYILGSKGMNDILVADYVLEMDPILKPGFQSKKLYDAVESDQNGVGIFNTSTLFVQQHDKSKIKPLAVVFNLKTALVTKKGSNAESKSKVTLGGVELNSYCHIIGTKYLESIGKQVQYIPYSNISIRTIDLAAGRIDYSCLGGPEYGMLSSKDSEFTIVRDFSKEDNLKVTTFIMVNKNIDQKLESKIIETIKTANTKEIKHKFESNGNEFVLIVGPQSQVIYDKMQVYWENLIK